MRLINTFLIVVFFFFFNSLNAQIIYYENFENFTLGNVSTSSDGQTAGQGGWYTYSQWTYQNNTPYSYLFQIQNEVAKGKVITMAPYPYPYSIGNTSIRKELNTEITNRTIGNDVLKLEVDFYTGQQANPLSSSVDFGLGRIFDVNNSATNVIAGFNFDNNTGELKGTHHDETGTPLPKVYQSPLGNNNQALIVPFNTWVRCVVYADYINNKVVYEIPSLNVFVEKSFFVNVPYPTNKLNHLADSFFAHVKLVEQTNVTLPTYKFDNIKVTALNKVLSTQEVLSSHFNLYPNPATDIVTITSNENIDVTDIKIYDLTGKLISTQYNNNEKIIQLNVTGLVTGTYLLHLQTNKGVAIKKMIKK
ncbi:T9SS type A sorting domain-containing protein [Flavobacterium sp. xlx-214]|uniref:T9SS type A sorting domain-containing protein n=1 Tax=unclassified Flavobacterium TaxID=196869 RepID=UPI0013D43B9A|nr:MULTISPECIES: T9SS type A sorting domain-containing protein [unclassified Flavobacterium]MBA5791241.1 T9SS type A sorting domain-containing protein [Flavobacterium sp. xlx-221]QMI83593.1 T9SS type A sorting domain-containing protein [Flavobacterium sp. xlx-214]